MKKLIQGDFVYARSLQELVTVKDGYLVLDEGGNVLSLKEHKPNSGEEMEVLDYRGQLIFPSFADLHLHAPQFPNIGLGMDMELLPWLETYTYPEEARYKDPEYAQAVYKKLINRLWEVGSLSSVIFSSIHRKTSGILYDLLVESGLRAYVGKVNMDRNAPDHYCETTKESLEETKRFIEEHLDQSKRVKPIITPRFVPSCSEELMKGLGELAKKYHLPIQSHLDENPGEIEWVHSLHPDTSCYAGVYRKFALLGDEPTLMAHCIYCSDEELEMLASLPVTAVHCPYSNANLISGIMPVRTYLEKGITVGMGSDISGGHELNMARVATMAIQMSKMLSVEEKEPEKCLSLEEAFYLATRPDPSYFGKIGCFEPGCPGDFLVVNDKTHLVRKRSLHERLEKYLYVGTTDQILHRYVQGQEIQRPF